MINITGSTLFIVGSPFQCLCMLEAINHWKLVDYDVMVNTTRTNEQMMSRLLIEKGIRYKSNYRVHLSKDIIPLFFSKHKHYNNVFIGNYYSLVYQDMAVAFSKRKAKVLCLDDGIQALQLFSDNPRKVKNKVWVDFIQTFVSLYAFIKAVKKTYFFTIYNVKSNKFIIEKNTFDILKTKNGKETDGIYIIGTNSSMLVFKDREYKDMIFMLVDRCKKDFPGQPIFYCPHRRDVNNKSILALLKESDVECFDTKISVEYDFVQRDIYPKAIFGFNSNALFTLHSIFPNTIANNIYFELNDKSRDMEASIIRNKLKEYGVLPIRL